MACPYFYPVAAIDRKQWPNPPLLPLGDPYRGECRVRAAGVHVPEEAAVRDLCNQGYARGACGEFPEGDGPDAVRFGIASDNGEMVRIAFVVERDHLPHARGVKEYSRASTSRGAETLSRQSEAYLESYLRRRRL